MPNKKESKRKAKTKKALKAVVKGKANINPSGTQFLRPKNQAELGIIFKDLENTQGRRLGKSKRKRKPKPRFTDS